MSAACLSGRPQQKLKLRIALLNVENFLPTKNAVFTTDLPPEEFTGAIERSTGVHRSDTEGYIGLARNHVRWHKSTLSTATG